VNEWIWFFFSFKQERNFGLESANNSFIAHALGLLPTLLDPKAPLCSLTLSLSLSACHRRFQLSPPRPPSLLPLCIIAIFSCVILLPQISPLSLSLSLFRCAVGCRADSILTSDWRRRFYNLCLIDPVRFLLRKQSEHDGAAISLIEISLSFPPPPFFCLFSSLCVVDTVWQCVFVIHYMWCRILLSGGICRRTCRARDRSLKHGVAGREISSL